MSFKHLRADAARTNPARNEHGAFARINRERREGVRVLEQLPISKAKPTLPRVKFLEGKTDD